MRLLDYQLLSTAEAPRRGTPVSLTALIDVVFILLLFFMLTSTFVKWRSLDVIMDTPGDAIAAESEEPLFIRLGSDGSLTVGDVVLPPPLNAAAIAAAVGELASGPVVLQPAGGATTQQVVSALDLLQGVGISRLTLANATPE